MCAVSDGARRMAPLDVVLGEEVRDRQGGYETRHERGSTLVPGLVVLL